MFTRTPELDTDTFATKLRARVYRDISSRKNERRFKTRQVRDERAYA